MHTKQYEVLQWASLFLEDHNREPKVAEILLQHHLNVSRSTFFAMMRDVVPETVVEKLKSDIRKHAETGIPVQHLTGNEMFYGRNFLVNEHVLIPRPETEELVWHVIQKAKKQKHPTIIDVGTGSGVIAITLALELPDATVYATDISKKALEIAHENAALHKADVSFLQGDFLQPFMDKNLHADIIVSNPPYIAKADESLLSDTVKNFDPKLALFADEDGLAAYKNIIIQSKQAVKSGSLLVFEIGHQQGEAVCAHVKNAYPTSEVGIIQDINKKDRIVTAKIK
ncbi:peptide chain release factor N(5)-glutamine methyltransferase [Virgibacillus ainsalahensis]